MSSPSITVLMPVYNAEKYLREAIESILEQTFTDFEFLIINDGSTDKSETIILSYQDPRIRYAKNDKNIKLIATLNKGFEMASGKYIARMDADDISLPVRLKEQFDFMEINSDIALCGSWVQMFGDKNKIVEYVGLHDEIMMKMLYQCHLCHPSVIMRKSMLESFTIKFDSRFLHAEDYDFFTRVGEKFKLANIQKVLMHYRIHTQSVSVQNMSMQNKNSSIIKKRLFERIGVNISEPELDIYKTIAQYEYQGDKEYLTQAQTLLENMAKANTESNYFEKTFFENYIAQFWFNIIFNTTGTFQTYQASILSSYQRLSLFQKFKFLIKGWFSK